MDSTLIEDWTIIEERSPYYFENDMSKSLIKSNDWNEYQKLEKLNLEPKFLRSLNEESITALASIKKGIYNPALPTLRRMDRDDAQCRLSTEHSRHNTFLPESVFNSPVRLGGSARIRKLKDRNAYTNVEKRLISNSVSMLPSSELPRINHKVSAHDLFRFQNYNRPMSFYSYQNINQLEDIKFLYNDYKNKHLI